MTSKSKTLFTVNSIISTVIVSMFLISIRCYSEALLIPINEQVAEKFTKLETKQRQNNPKHSLNEMNKHFMDEQLQLDSEEPFDHQHYILIDNKNLPSKRSWQNLQNPWGKRVTGHIYNDENDELRHNADTIANIDNDDYADMLLLMSKPYANKNSMASLRPDGHVINTNYLDGMITTENGQKREWKNLNGVWGKRVNARNMANRNNNGN